jgi:hypothetical protein
LNDDEMFDPEEREESPKQANMQTPLDDVEANTQKSYTTKKFNPESQRKSMVPQNLLITPEIKSAHHI